MMHTTALVALLLYAVAGMVFFYDLWKGHASKSRFGSRAYFFGYLSHSLALFLILLDVTQLFRDNGSDYFFFVSWAFASVFLYYRSKLDFPIVGAFAVPAIMLFMASSSFLLHHNSSSALYLGERGTLHQVMFLVLHAIPAMLAVVSMAIAFVLSAVFLVLDKRIRMRRSAAIVGHAPNLQSIDLLNRRATMCGFLCISAVILSGSVWAISEGRPVFGYDASVLSALGVWVLLALVLHARITLRWPARRISKLTVCSTGLFFISIFVVMLLSGRLTHGEFL